MKTFTIFLKEALENTSEPKKVSLFLGRFQPFHIGHTKIFNMMKYKPMILLVKGAKSSLDKNKNPLSVEYQKKLIKTMAPNAEIRVVANANLKAIIGFIEADGYKVSEILAGEDRMSRYKAQVTKYYPAVEFTETPRFTSATEVRNAIKSNDEATFKKLMPSKLYGEWNTLRKLIQ